MLNPRTRSLFGNNGDQSALSPPTSPKGIAFPSFPYTQYLAFDCPAHSITFLDMCHGHQGLGDAYRQGAVASPRDSPDPPFGASSVCLKGFLHDNTSLQ